MSHAMKPVSIMQTWWLWTTWNIQLPWIMIFYIATIAMTPQVTAAADSLIDLHFTQDLYNCTVPENSLGKTYVTSSSKMGIFIPEHLHVAITYSLLNPDPEGDLFKLEDYVLGDFSFLLIRTHSGSYGRLNREFVSEYQLTVKAVCVGKDGSKFETTTSVRVGISDLNDLQPLFDHDTYNVTVPEDTQLHTSIAKVSAYDGDDGINAQIYYSFLQKTNTFAIHPTSGVVTLTHPLNFLVQKEYSVKIMAEDRGPLSSQPMNKRPAILKVYVQPINYFAPDISVQQMMNLFQPGQDQIVLANVYVADRDIGENGKVRSVDVVKDNLTHSIWMQKNETDGEYQVMYSPGKKGVTLSAGLNVTVQATDMGKPPLTSNKTFYINIFDTNIVPECFQSEYNVQVEEITPINTPVVFINATKFEYPVDIQYEINSGDAFSLFKINPVTGLISTSSSLDAEVLSTVQLKINIFDAVHKRNSNKYACTVKIAITDNNDNTPKFHIYDNVSETYISENWPAGSSIFTIDAIDKDQNENGKLSFSITNSGSVPFEIEPFTGVVKTTSVLDYETMRRTYKLNIRVSDWGKPYPRENEMIFTINLQDTNDNEPHFEKTNCKGYISREAAIGSELLIVPAIDFDIKDVLRYEIIAGNTDGCFQIQHESAKISLNCSLRNLEEQSRSIQVIARDGEHDSEVLTIEITLVNSKQDNQLVNIKCAKTDIFQKLQDLLILSHQNNEAIDFGITKAAGIKITNTAPYFNESIPRYMEVSENLASGTVIAQLTAIDNDLGFNGKLVYSIKSGDSDASFKIDMYTGGLLVMSKLDREIRDEFILLVEVSDLGIPSMTANLSLKLKILDENDNPPKFERELYTAIISENAIINGTIIQVSATDRDLGKNGEITYSIVSDTDHFSIDSKNGVVYVNKALDREKHLVYKVLVRASDKGEKQVSLSSTATIEVTLKDVNDVVPRFSPDLYSVKVCEDLPLGTVVAVVTAADTDEEKNGIVTYKLVYGEEYFEIDAETGVIRLIKKLDYEAQQVHNISVRAQDGGSPPLTSACSLNIEVVDVNENFMAPVFENFFAHGYVNENEPVGTTVMFVQAYDPDSTDVIYSIRDGTGLGRFTIDANGTICTSQVLDRETATHYWLSVYAQDQGLVPLHTRLEVYIEVKDTNDNIPMTLDPVYYGSVLENTEDNIFITRVQAFDLDKNPAQHLTYKITRYDPSNFFNISQDTGVITTSGKPLDRERQSVHQLEVTISDNGEPALTYQSRVFIKVNDDNDNRPIFSDRSYRIRALATTFTGLNIPVFQVLAWDDDEGPNGELVFDIRPNREDSAIFIIHPSTGMVYATSNLNGGEVHHFVVRASDRGDPKPQRTTVKVRIEVMDRPKTSQYPPNFTVHSLQKHVMENDKVGNMVELIQGTDKDLDMLFYSVIDGDPDHHFYIGLDAGNLVVARPLDRETKREYNLTIQVTDGIHFDNCTIYIQVKDINDNVPLFEYTHYEGSYPESIPIGTTLLKVMAVDADDTKLIYSLPKSCNSDTTLELFTVIAETGEILVKSSLDREVSMLHNLTVMVSDQGITPNRNFTRVTINILDNNDHRPVFLADKFYGRVFETAALGSSVLQVMAMDQDKGENAEITYSVVSGNNGGVFDIDGILGIITVAQELDRRNQAKYNLVIMARDNGDKPLSSTATVSVDVTVSDNAPPTFDSSEYMAELHENHPAFTNVYTVKAECRSSIIYTIVDGNKNNVFAINPNSGVVFTKKSVDFEEDHFFNMTIKATSVIYSSAVTNLLIHIIDENDNAPEFIQGLYVGYITESVKSGSMVLDAASKPLVVMATDRDYNLNAMLMYEIREKYAKDFIEIDTNTGAVRTLKELDHEETKQIEFSVEVWDMGKPQQRSKYPAKVIIYVNDINDTPPKFSLPNYSAKILLPIYQDVIVVKTEASDADTGVNSKLKYSLIAGNDWKKFRIDQATGAVYIVNDTNIADNYTLSVAVTDGTHKSEAKVNIFITSPANRPFNFTQDFYKVSVKENSAVVSSLTVIQVANRGLNEQYYFSLLNGGNKFEIGYTSGVVTTTGIKFDREDISEYNVVVEAKQQTSNGFKLAHAIIKVIIEDENDNSPMFINQPYHAVVFCEASLGHTIKQVAAIDRDADRFGRVTFSMRARGYLEDIFAIDPATGKINIFNRLTVSDIGKEITLSVKATDGGNPSRTTETSVKVTVIDKSYPVFDQQVYHATIPELYPSGMSVISVSAQSPTGQKLIYTIVDGDRYGDFDVDYSIGLLIVHGAISYDQTSTFNLTIQATEFLSGLTATAMVIINILDCNTHRPIFIKEQYLLTILEVAAIETSLVTVVATDPESGDNGLVFYSLHPAQTGRRDVDWFAVDSETGIITTKKFFDREKQSEFSFLVEASDSGVPPLTNMVPVTVIISDLNDNAPVFDQPWYECLITDQGARGQLVTKVSATDPDSGSVDPDGGSFGQLRYSIIGGNNKDTFQMDEHSGIISLSSQRKPDLYLAYDLNISVSDDVFTSFARVTIKVQNSNNHAPKFEHNIYIAQVPENYGEGMLVTQVTAKDDDAGNYGMITYSISSEVMAQFFRIDADTGELFSEQVLDREQQSFYNVPVAATDNGGRMTFTSVRISVIDQNDNVPQFLAQEYKCTLLHTMAINTTILMIQANDADIGDNGKISYSFAPGTSSLTTHMFNIDTETGIIFLVNDLKDYISEIFQFFIQASDHGSTPMKNSVPVNIWVIDNSNAQPKFAQSSYIFFVRENEAISTVVATVNAASTQPLEYVIVPGFTKSSNSPAKFGIDNKGCVHIAGRLDMEDTFAFVLTIQAQTLGASPLIQQTTVNIQLLDINDNCPYFESNPYIITVPENLGSGIDIVQVSAIDLDKSSKFRYTFDEEMHQYSHLFHIDSSTGVISLLSSLDRENQALYNLTVWVKDSDEADAHKNFTIVQVKVIDYNDNPPIFTRSHYQAAVNEDAYEGTILMTLSTVDKDSIVNLDTSYYIINGDPEGKFKINKNGDIFVNRQLDREAVPRYELVIAATDGGFVSMATLTVDIIDANDNYPICDKLEYYARVSEDVSPSWIIMQLKASDVDSYGSLRFELHGEGSEKFYLEPTSGLLTAVSMLDRETKNSYQFEARAIDIGNKSCSMMIKMDISDINDNAPVFANIPGPIQISEGAEINTLVYRIAATDADLGINRQIMYSLKKNPDAMFKIDAKSGLLQLSKKLDRETTQSYTVVVEVNDKGTPQLSNQIEVEILVLDENDNPPEFEHITYWASVLENASIGQYVTQVQATSKDTGMNAKISYILQAGNDKEKFTIETDTGLIRTNGYLDHEIVSSYFLTVRAQDHGEPPFHNLAYVQIHVTDINDNPPVFTLQQYSAQVREDAQIGSRVIKVLTSDLDGDSHNRAVNYSIVNDDHLCAFDIHPTEGIVVVRSTLDRESVDSYTLNIRARNYHLSADITIMIEVLDANDSPPRFTKDNYTIFVQEDRSVTSCIYKFEVTDDDLDPNGAPFTFDIIDGDGMGKFRVDRNGNLCIAGTLNRLITATYDLTVRVFDNGMPAMYSNVRVKVDVLEESTYSPVLSDIEVSINSYLDAFPGGVIGELQAVDNDKFDTLNYEVISPNHNLFDIDKRDGRIIAFAGLDAGMYVLNVSVSDGKYTSYGAVKIEVNVVTSDLINNSITIQFMNMEAQYFVKNCQTKFKDMLKRDFGIKAQDVVIISVQEAYDTFEVSNRVSRSADKNLDVLFAVRKGQEYITRERLKWRIIKIKPDLESVLEVRVLKVFSDICGKDMCAGGECVSNVEIDVDTVVPIIVDRGSFVSVKHRYTYECHCPNGFIGDNCVLNPTNCAQRPCPVYKVCSPHPVHGYQCNCPAGKSGKYCDRDMDNKCDDTNCHRGDTPITFSGSSFARWTLLEPIVSRLSLFMRIKTLKASAILMYAKGRVDYSILELHDGMVQYRFECGSGEGLVLIPNLVSDGKWHTIMIERHGNQAELFLDGQYAAITSAPGNNAVLNLDTNYVYFGAEVETYANGFIDIRKGFRGCIEDIRIYNVRLPIAGSNAVALSQDFEKVEFSCKDSDFDISGNNICSRFPCMNNGLCEPTGSVTYICKCGERYRGTHCEIDKEPCQRQPCLNGGICENIPGIPNEFSCKCPGELRGKRCEYGKLCLPSPCQHGGTCIETPSMPQCLCRTGFTGTRCESIINMCESSPCQNNGECVQDSKGYVCNCSHSYSGLHCEDVILPVISSISSGVNSLEIYAISGVCVGLIVIITIIVVLLRIRQRNHRHNRANITAGLANDSNDVFLNLLINDKHNFNADNKLKIDNINNKHKAPPPSPKPPPVPDRPASYTPSARDSVNTLNNFDQSQNRSYGSAADDLDISQNIPNNHDFLQTFAPLRAVPQPADSDTGSLPKDSWEFACQNILQNYVSDKHSDKISKRIPVSTVQRISYPHLQDNTSLSSLPISESEDDQQGYHWDTSDWAPEKTLPNISEVPVGECPDSPGSSRLHNNDSNTHIDDIRFSGQYNTDSEYNESEYIDDSEYAEHDMEEPPEFPNYELLAEQNGLMEDYVPNKHIKFHVHPNYYLPLNTSFTSAEGQNEDNLLVSPPFQYNNRDINGSDSSQTTSPEGNIDLVQHYGFPLSQNRINRLSVITDSDVNVDENRLSAFIIDDGSTENGKYCRASVADNVSNISGLCNIGGSEMNSSDSEDERTPLPTDRTHTQV